MCLKICFLDHMVLFNINERIRLEYGAGYGLKIDSEKGKGTTVYITIPIKK